MKFHIENLNFCLILVKKDTAFLSVYIEPIYIFMLD